MDWTGCKYVESEPDKLSGVPILIHSRMQADGVVDNYLDGMSAEEIADDFELDIESVRGVLEFAKVLRRTPISA